RRFDAQGSARREPRTRGACGDIQPAERRESRRAVGDRGNTGVRHDHLGIRSACGAARAEGHVLSPMDWQAIALSLRLASATTLVLLAIGLPLAAWLAFSNRSGRWVVDAIVALPLVLPPTVLGFYVLVALGPRSPLGRIYETLTGSTIVFSFEGLLAAS